MKRIYLDHASITPVSKEVSREMRRVLKTAWGNPGSIHAEGVAAEKALLASRKKAAEFLHCHSDEVIFTGGGTEANNMAVFGIFKNLVLKSKVAPSDLHAILSSIEHPSIRECGEHLRELGVSVDYLSVGKDGLIHLEEVKEKLKPNTFLVSVMLVNNEIGTIQPISEIAKIIRHAKKEWRMTGKEPLGGIHTVFHTDASQAPLWMEINVEKLGVDSLTLDGQKIYGPRGVGLLYKKRSVELSSIMYGGNQEKGFRPGTENVVSIAGFAKALELAEKKREKDSIRLRSLRDYFISELTKFPGVSLNGSQENRIPNNVNISILRPGFDPEFFLLQLDANGIAVSTKSACLRDEDESYVIKSLAYEDKEEAKNRARSSIRFSLGKETKEKDIRRVIKVMEKLLLKF